MYQIFRSRVYQRFMSRVYQIFRSRVYYTVKRVILKSNFLRQLELIKLFI